MLRVGIWAESFRCAGILLLQWQGENFAHRRHLKFCHFQPLHCAIKNAISSKVFNRFSKSLPRLEDVEGGHLGGRFQVRRYFIIAMARGKFCASTTFEILPLSTCTLRQQKCYISKGIQPIFEIVATARRCWGWSFGWKISGAQVFYYCNGKGEILRIDNIWNFALSTCTQCQQKSYISKGIQPIFEIFASARRCWGWAFGWEASGAEVFYFSTGKVKTLRIDNIWNFATLNQYSVPAKMLYLQRYSTDFPNLCPCSKILRVGIWVEGFRCAGILLFNGKVKTWRMDNIWNFATLNQYRVPAKILYLERYSTDFRNLCLSSKMLRVGIWRKVSGAQVFYFCKARWNLSSKNAISPEVFNNDNNNNNNNFIVLILKYIDNR